MQQTNENPRNGSPRASAAAVHGGWDDVAAAERAGAGRNSGSGSGPVTVIESQSITTGGNWMGETDVCQYQNKGAEKGQPKRGPWRCTKHLPRRHQTCLIAAGGLWLRTPNANYMEPIVTSDQLEPNNASDFTDPTKYTGPTQRINRNIIEKKRRQSIKLKNSRAGRKMRENKKNNTRHQTLRRINRDNTNQENTKKRRVKNQMKHSKKDTSKKAGIKETVKSKNRAGKPRQEIRQNKQSDNHQKTKKYQMSATEDLNQTVNAYIRKSHIDELAEAGGIKDRSSKAKLGRIINSAGITVPTIAETSLGNRLTFKCTRGQFHFLNQEIALRGDSRVFFEMSQEDETTRPTIMIMEVAEAFDKFAGVQSIDQYGKEDPNSRSGKVVVTLSYASEAEKIQSLEVSGIPFNGHHVYPVDPNEPIQMRIDREKPRWLIAPDLDDGTEIKDWFKVKNIKYQRIKMTRDGLEILVTTTAEANRWDGKKVSNCTWKKNRKQLRKNAILSKKIQQLATQTNGYEVQVTVYRKYVMDQGTYRLRDHCKHCQKDHPSHLCQIPRQQEDSDWQKVADERLVFNFSSADITRIEKSVRNYAERKNGLTQAEARGCQTLRIKIDSAWIQKENRRHQENLKQPHAQPQTKPTLGRRSENTWNDATANYANAAINAANTSALENQIRERIKKEICEEMTNLVENLVNNRIAEELEEWKNELQRERDERLAEEETEQETQLDEVSKVITHPGSSPSSTWMEAVDKAISRMEENQLRTDQNIERIDRNIDRLEVETGVAQGVVFDSNEEAMDIEDEDAEVTTPNALKPGRTKND
ncbi:hypothetical protein BDR26DRAFT_953916 [Obelidium mucronatum]|nr:hypothetical protein BDR26DRAFT_953916 [Obelidium mucronatum]